MKQNPRDEDGPFDDMFRMIEELMEGMAENMDRMMGPYGSVDFDMEHQLATPGREQMHTVDTHVDMQEEDDEIRVVADLPGVSKDSIGVMCDGRTLSITAEGDRREYSERLRLPARVDAEATTASYNNGILDVTLPRQDTGSGTSIDIN